MSTLPDHEDEAANDPDHASLFARVGVTDLTDWRTLALRLSEHAPALVRKKSGRPPTWTNQRMWLLMTFVEMVKDASRDGTIRHADIETDRAACRLISGAYPATAWMRDALGLAPGINPRTLENRLIEARSRDRQGWPDRSKP